MRGGRNNLYYVYMLRCEDNSVYTGITTDVARRMSEHFTKGAKCAKYTLRHGAKSLEAVWEVETRSDALRLEYRIKQLTKCDKEQLIKKPWDICALSGGGFSVSVCGREKRKKLL